MRLCYIASGESIHVKRWLSYFVKRGHEVHLISDILPSWDGIVYHEFELHHPHHIIPFLKRISKLKRLIKEISPDILHAHYISSCGIWGALSNFSPFVASAWGCDVMCSRCSYSDCSARIHEKSKFQEILKSFAIAKTDLLTGNAREDLDAAITLGKVNNNKMIEKVRMGVNLRDFNPKIKSEVRKRLGWNKSFIVISSRSLDPIYNIDIFIESIPIILKSFPEAKFMIMSYGPLEEDLKKQVKVLGISDSVIFTGYLPDEEYPKYLICGDVYVSVPFSDGFPSSVLEAMACQKAVIVSDVKGPKELIKDGWNGFVIPIRDAESLAEKVIILLKNGELRRQFGERGYKVVKEEADYNKHMSKMESLYKELVSKRGKKRGQYR